MYNKLPIKAETPASPIEDTREIDIRAMEEREREGYARMPQSKEEAELWERAAVWPPE